MYPRARHVLLAFFAGALLFAPMFVPASSAQVLYGSVVGTVKDQTGAMIPGATVTITNAQTGQTRESISDATGYYAIPNVLEGTYDLSVKMTGFKNYLQRGVTIAINTVRRTDVTLQVGQLADTVTVEASAAVLQTSKADVSVNLESREVENLPLGNYRNYRGGKLIDTIEVSERPLQLVFGGPDRRTLFIPARTSLYSVRMRYPGR